MAADPAVFDWNEVLEVSKAAARAAINAWIDQARFDGGTVNGSAARITPNTLTSGVVSMRGKWAGDMAAAIHEVAPSNVARLIAERITDAWTTWAKDYQNSHPSLQVAFSGFTAIPNSRAPATPATTPSKVPFSLQLNTGSSNSAFRLAQAALSSDLINAINSGLGRFGYGEPSRAAQTAPPPGAQASSARLSAQRSGAVAKPESVPAATTVGTLESFASGLALYISQSFARWKDRVTIVNLVGSGDVPTFAPPYVPVGPVAGGKLSGNKVLSGPSFG